MKLSASLRATWRFLALAAVATALLATPAMAKDGFPDVVALPDGWRPEGVVIGHGTTFYAGSLANGAIWRGDLKTGDGAVLAAGGPGQVTVGLEFEQRGRLWAAGGPTGVGKVYDADTGQLLETYPFGGTFINDVVVTPDAAYFTDSAAGRLFKVALGPGGRLPGPTEFTAIPLTGDFVATPTPNANGIETTPDGKALLVVQTATGQLFRVDPATGEATDVTLTGGSGNVLRGDGIVRSGTTLYVVQNSLNQIAVVDLDGAGTTGEITEVLTDPDLDVPTTADLFGSAIYAVNARFSTPPTPTTHYEVVRVER